MVVNSKTKIYALAELLQLKVFLICIIFGKKKYFFPFSRYPISMCAKVEQLISLFSSLLGHMLCTECISNSFNNESGPEKITDKRPKPNVLLIYGLD